MEFRAGTTYRLRFMHISPDDRKRISLLAGGEPVQWRFVARDGADLPSSQVQTLPADLPSVDVGTSFDVLWTPQDPGELTFEIVTTFDGGLAAFPREAPPSHTMEVPVRVQ